MSYRDALLSLDLPRLNIEYSIFAEEKDAQVDESYEISHKTKIPVKLLLETRCLVTQLLMAFLFNGSSTSNWKKINISQIFNYPYSTISIAKDTEDDIEESDEVDNSHAFFVFKDTDGKFYKVESYYYINSKVSTATITEFSALPQIESGYEWIVYAPKSNNTINIHANVKKIKEWLSVEELSDEYSSL